MKLLQGTATALLLSLLLGCSSTVTPIKSAPDADGTFTVREKGVLQIAAGGRGQGTLILHGWEYPFAISNMTLSGVGPGEIQLEGDVFSISRAADFEGTYQLRAAEVQAGEGARGFWFENEKGVRVHVRTRGQDVTVRVGTGGSIVTLK